MKPTKRKYSKTGSRGICEILLDNQAIGRTYKDRNLYRAIAEDGKDLGLFNSLKGAEHYLYKYFKNS